MTFRAMINEKVLSAMGFDVPELGGKGRVSRKEVLAALRHAKRWHEDFATQCQNNIDDIIHSNFSDREIYAEEAPK